ncbi:hypothetical protein [Bradyrhizobium sp. USDA 10063]
MFLLVGPAVWALHLTAIYGAHALLCARGIAADTATAVIMIATGVALIVLMSGAGAAWLKLRRGGAETAASSFQASVMSLLAVLSAIGIAWAGATALFVTPCVALR